MYIYIYIHIIYPYIFLAYKYLGSLSWGLPPPRRLDHFFSDSARGAHHTHLGRPSDPWIVVADPVPVVMGMMGIFRGNIIGISPEYHREIVGSWGTSWWGPQFPATVLGSLKSVTSPIFPNLNLNGQYITNMIRIRHIIGNMYWKD